MAGNIVVITNKQVHPLHKGEFAARNDSPTRAVIDTNDIITTSKPCVFYFLMIYLPCVRFLGEVCMRWLARFFSVGVPGLLPVTWDGSPVVLLLICLFLMVIFLFMLVVLLITKRFCLTIRIEKD